MRGLSEKEVRADTAELTIAINFKGNIPGELFPKLEDAQKKIVAELNAQGINEKEITLGQWTSKRTDSFYLKDDPTMPRYNADGSVTIKTHNVAAVEKVVAKLNELQVATEGAIAESKVAYRFNGLGALRAEMHATQHYNLQRTQVARWGQLAMPHKACSRSSPVAVMKMILRRLIKRYA